MCYSDVKELNENILQLQNEILKLKQENDNLKQHIMLKDEKITEQRFKINSLENMVEKYSNYIGSMEESLVKLHRILFKAKQTQPLTDEEKEYLKVDEILIKEVAEIWKHKE